MPPDPATYDYSKAALRCDVVMKGGITSGVVYPHAVCELARDYRFANVGGTSAGAIAAAATAAAELGRERGGFNALASLPRWIAGDRHLERLFQPQRSTRALYLNLIAAIDRRPTSILRALPTFPLAKLIGLAPGVALLVLALASGSGALRIAAIVAGVLLVLLGLPVCLTAAMALSALRVLPANRYGLCSGWAPRGEHDPEPLTTWLHDLLRDYAWGSHGGGAPDTRPPLTFGDLDSVVGLQMMTTNLTNRRGHRLPMDPGGWYFDPGELRELFPPEVVDWMVEHPPPGPIEEVTPSGLRPLPAPADLPVIVATRMSLSFPVLLSAIPLWRVDPLRNADRPDGERRLAERCWFSDGGIASNFPVHFFDSFVPRWPTFAINLRPFAAGRPESQDEEQNVFMVHDEREPITDWWYREPAGWAGRLPAFLSGVVRTMQNRVDEAQMRVPGYRDRVVHVGMTQKEGGMNLTMPAPLIDRLTLRGRYAGARLARAYAPRPAPGEEVTWTGHRWTRLRSTVAVFEDMLAAVVRGYDDPPLRSADPTYQELVESGEAGELTGYELTPAQRGLALAQVGSARALTNATQDAGTSLADGAPQPAPVGRIAPEE